MAKKIGMLSLTHESDTVLVGRVRKMWIAMKTNKITECVTVPSEKKN